MATTRGIKRKFSAIEMVLLVVGREKIEISVHENVLFEASTVFKTAFTSKFREGSERSIYLPDDDADLMDTLVQHLYAPQDRICAVYPRMDDLCLYVLADKYNIVQVKNRICSDIFSSLVYRRSSSEFVRQGSARPRNSAIQFIYENTTSKTPMRRLMVDWFVWAVDSTWFSNEENRNWLLSVPDFAMDICAVLAKGFVKKSPGHPFDNKRSVYLEEEPVKDPKHVK